MKFVIGAEAVNAYKRLSYTPWHALAEFIDNSTQAYFDNRALLDPLYADADTTLEVSIVYDRQSNTLTIKDNSIGMAPADLEKALEVAGAPPKPTGRSKYGMGLKTAACWFGDEWMIKTKKLGDPIETTVRVNVPSIATGKIDLAPALVDTKSARTHYTELTITRLHKKLAPQTIKRIKQFLRSMYRCDLRQKLLSLSWQEAPLTWKDFDDRILNNTQGRPYKKFLDFEVLGHKVTGWVAVLGSGSREIAGFTILQNNRVIKGYPDSWRPTSLYGQLQGSNDTINQRLVGEIHLDGFDVTHTKDDIVWAGEEEEAVEEALLAHCRDYREVARQKLGKDDERMPSVAVAEAAADQVGRDLKSDVLVDLLELSETPPADVIDATFRAVVNQEKGKSPTVDVKVGKSRVKLHLNYSGHATDPYYAIDIDTDETIIVVVNMVHPYLVNVDNRATMTDYLRQCVYDAISENKTRIQKGVIHANTFRSYKDQLLRVPYTIHDETEDVPRVEEPPPDPGAPTPKTA